jgi:hypothetical protein
LQVTSGETTEGAPRSAPLPEAVVSRKHLYDPSRLLHPFGARTSARLLGGIRGEKCSTAWEDGRRSSAAWHDSGKEEARLLGEDKEGLGKAHQLPHVLTCSQHSHTFSTDLLLSGYGVQTLLDSATPASLLTSQNTSIMR